MSTKLCAVSDTSISWDEINFKEVERCVKKLQKRIALAYDNDEADKAISLQHKMVHSFYAKVLAVKHVTSNRGNRTPGVDKEVWDTSEKKMEAVLGLNRRGYKPKPLKRIQIMKPNGKLRPLSIPTFKDRAMQTLYKFALEPIAEVTADNGSYGFRPKRSARDAVKACAGILAANPNTQWVLKADIQSCFDDMSHEWILKNIPMDKQILRKILKCGFVEEEKFYPTNKGIPQGGCLSSVICNMALDGMERLLMSQCGEDTRLIRYADDFIITGPNQKILVQSVIPVIQKFLSERGLSLSCNKTNVAYVEDGFSFLGYTIYQQKGQIYLVPTRRSIDSLLKKINNVISRCNMEEKLYERLKHIIRGWMNYYAGISIMQSLHSVEAEALFHLMKLTDDIRIAEFVKKQFASYDRL